MNGLQKFVEAFNHAHEIVCGSAGGFQVKQKSIPMLHL
jgi:Fe-S oxidoreductase